MITENLSTLKIHKLTKEQYERELAAGNIDANALYLTPDEELKFDTTLSISGQAADAKAVGEALAEKQPKGDYALKSDITKELPVVSTSDDGKFLRVVAGQWAAQTILNAEEVAF